MAKERKYVSKADYSSTREKFMTQDEMKEVDDLLSKIIVNQGSMGDLYSEWQDIETAYRGEQPKIDGRPNTRVNLINANIEGQIANIIDQNIAITTRGQGPSDENYAEFARIGLDWTFRKNYIKKVIEQHERRRLKFGVGIFKVQYDADAIGGYGLVKVTCVPLNKIFVDGKVKDPLKLNDAEYIAESIRMSKQQVIDIYGEEKADAIQYGYYQIEDTTVFEEKDTEDDETGTTILQCWEKHKGILRLREFSACGTLLFDSHKGDDRKENQKNKKYEHVPYYEQVNNKYPYFITVLYPVEGRLFGFGDGKLLQPLNDMLNDFYDKIRIAARPNLILFDPNSEVDLEDFDENSFEPRPAMMQGGQVVQSVPWGTVNESWWRMINQIHSEAQRVTRFSDLMMGQGSNSANTATEATIQQQQGNNATDQKKQILQVTMQEMCEYILGVLMTTTTEAKAYRLTEDKPDFVWIDFRELNSVPVMKPSTRDFRRSYMEASEKDGMPRELPEWEILTDDSGEPLTKTVDLDIEINIGAGLPKNKAFLWQMIEKLSQMASIDANGMKKTVVSYEELREFIKKFVGLPLEDEQVDKMLQQPVPGTMPGQIPQGNPAGMSADGNLSMNGNPLMSNLPPQPQQGGVF